MDEKRPRMSDIEFYLDTTCQIFIQIPSFSVFFKESAPWKRRIV